MIGSRERASASAAALFFLSSCSAPTEPLPVLPSPSSTPSGYVLGLIHEECVGLVKNGDCANARVACAKATALFQAAGVPASDRQHVAVLDARTACERGTR